MNKRYKVDDKDFVLSEEEHNKVQSLILQGKSVISLRGGKMLINANFIRYIVETDHLTDEQEKENENRLRLKDAQENARGFKRGNFEEKTHHPFFLKMGWEHNQGCACFVEGKCEECGLEESASPKRIEKIARGGGFMSVGEIIKKRNI